MKTNNFKVINKPLEVGDYVRVCNMLAPYYGRVGKITHVDGVIIDVKLGLLTSCKLHARCLQVVEDGHKLIQKEFDETDEKLSKQLCNLLPSQGVNVIMEKYNMDYDTARACYCKWRNYYLK